MDEATSRTLALMCCVCSMVFVGFINCQPAPFFPTFAANEKQLSKTEIGLVFASLDVAAISTRLLLTHRIQTHQTRAIFLACNFVFSFSCISFALLYFVQSSSLFFIGCLLSRALSGIMMALNTFVLLSLVLSWFPKRQSQMVGFIQGSYALS